MTDLGGITEINTGAYTALSSDNQNMLQHLKLLVLHDTNANAPWFPSGDPDKMDAYAWFLESCVNDINITLRTSYNPRQGQLPDVLSYVTQIGTTINAIDARLNEFIEIENISVPGVAYADARDFVDRWSARVAELRTAYDNQKSNLRLHMLPRGTATVDYYNFMGVNQIPQGLAGLPTWFFPYR